MKINGRKSASQEKREDIKIRDHEITTPSVYNLGLTNRVVHVSSKTKEPIDDYYESPEEITKRAIQQYLD